MMRCDIAIAPHNASSYWGTVAPIAWNSWVMRLYHTFNQYILYQQYLQPHSHQFIYLSIHLSINASIHPSIHPSIYLSIYLSINSSIYLTIYLPLQLSSILIKYQSYIKHLVRRDKYINASSIGNQGIKATSIMIPSVQCMSTSWFGSVSSAYYAIVYLPW